MKLRLAALLAVTLLSACRHAGDITAENGGGVYAVRSACPIAGIPAGTGDITLFNPPDSTDARAIDVTAAITDVRATCQDTGNDVVSTVTFTSSALRRDAGPGAAGRPALFRRRAAGRQQRSSPSRSARSALNFPAGEPARLDAGPGDGAGQSRRGDAAGERPRRS